MYYHHTPEIMMASHLGTPPNPKALLQSQMQGRVTAEDMVGLRRNARRLAY